MADSKVSALTAATSLGGSDSFYLVQSGASKQITAATLFSNAGNVTLKGNVNIGGTPQSLGAAGIISLTTPITHLSVGSSPAVVTVPKGTEGQQKYVVLTSTTGGSYSITSNVAGNANVVFSRVGDSATMLYTSNAWFVIGGTANVEY